MNSELIKIKSPSHRKQPSTADRFGLLYKIERESISQLMALFNENFDAIEELLLNAANHASNNQEHSHYFGFIKELHQKRNQAQNRFRHYLTQNFRALNKSEKQLWKSSMIDLYSIEELELEVAINNIVTRIRCAHPRPLLHLMTRLNTLIPQARITTISNPLGPNQVVSSFVIAISPFQLDTDTRLQLIKKFEDLILDSIESILNRANQTLIEAGYLPNINAVEIRSFYFGEDSSKEPQHDVAKEESVVPITSDAKQDRDEEVTPKQLPCIQQGRLFKLLDYLQQCQLKTPFAVNPLQVKPLINSLLQDSVAEHEARQLSPRDSKIFSLMDLSFQFIYSQGLPTNMTLLIAQLQIPLLKVAICDPDFLRNRTHPARKLINLIANSGITWEAPMNDDIYQSVQQIVSSLANEFYGDPLLLQKLASTLVSKIETEQQRAKRLEVRVIELEKGKAKTEQIRNQIKNMLNDRMQGKRLPAAIIQFVQKTWQPIILQAWLKQGSTSPEVKEALTLVDNLLSVCQTFCKLESTNVEPLISFLSDYLTKAKIDQQQVNVALTQLQNTLESASTSQDLIEFDALNIEMGLMNNVTINNATGVDPVALKDVRQQIERLNINTWFEFQGKNSNAPTRCKLVAALSETDSFVFTNRFGQRALVISKDELAASLYENQARPIITGPLIDRALKTAASEVKATLLTA